MLTVCNRKFLANIGVGKSHAGEHLDKVVYLTRKAAEGVDERQMEILLVAAELHETDDKKYGGDATFKNARMLMEECGYDASFIEDVIVVIGLVSCSANKDTVPEGIEEWQLIVREADRLEGVSLARLADYSEESGQPPYLESTPRVKTIEEIYEIATTDRYLAYKKSVSSIDHLYDKLLHILKAIKNPYLRGLADGKQEKMENLCLYFGEKGTITTDEIRMFD